MLAIISNAPISKQISTSSIEKERAEKQPNNGDDMVIIEVREAPSTLMSG